MSLGEPSPEFRAARAAFLAQGAPVDATANELAQWHDAMGTVAESLYYEGLRNGWAHDEVDSALNLSIRSRAAARNLRDGNAS